MLMNEYQAAAKKTAIYPGRGTPEGLAYTTLALVGEAGEIANQVKKVRRDDGGVLTHSRRNQLIAELGDVLWYAAMLATELGMPLAAVAANNLNKLQARQSNNTIRGQGDAR